MLCRAVLTALAISYLICVLWLSGLQKEDLDVNMLRKLHRHNVNIDDNNRDTLRQDCLNTYGKKDIKPDKSIATYDDDMKPTTVAFESETETNTKSDESEPVNKSMLDAFLRVKQRSEERDTTATRDNVELTTLRPEYDNENDSLKEITDVPTTQTTEKPVTNKEQQNLDSLMTLWKLFTTPRSIDSAVPVSKSTRIYKRKTKKKFVKKSPVTELKRNSREVAQINKLLADYFYKTIKSSTTQSSVISNADLNHLDKLAQQFENYFKLMSMSKMVSKSNEDVKKYLPNENPKTGDTATDNNIFFNKNMSPSFLVRASNKQFIKNNNKQSISDISHILIFNDQAKKQFLPKNASYSPAISISDQQYFLVPDNSVTVATTTITTTQPTTTTKNNTVETQDIKVKVSKDLIGMIAANVKEIVLKDLRIEISSTTVDSTTSSMAPTTTTVTPTTVNVTSPTSATTPSTVTKIATTTQKPTENKTGEATQVLKSIMDLFKEFKALKDQTSATSTSIPDLSRKDDIINNVYFNPMAIKNIVPMQAKSPFLIKNPPELADFSHKMYEPQSVRQYRPPTNLIGAERTYSDAMIMLPKPIVETGIIINEGEVPPLGIPLSRPSSLIHQNIVVTTSTPQTRTVRPREPWIIDHHYTNSNNRYESRYLRDKLEQNRHPNISQYNAVPSYSDATHARYSYVQPEHIYSQPYAPQKESNYSQYNVNLHRDDRNQANYNPNLAYRFNTRIQHNSGQSERSHLFQYGANQFKVSTSPTRYDLLAAHYRTRIPADNYDGRSQRYQEDQKSRLINRGRNTYHLAYSPRHDVIAISTKTKGIFGHSNRESNNNYKGSSGSGSATRYSDTERFHEKLERSDADTDDYKPEKCCDDLTLAARQQMALNTMQTKYDDSHFKNFLKTQQKVNDMLERMLASKISETRSVEVI